MTGPPGASGAQAPRWLAYRHVARLIVDLWAAVARTPASGPEGPHGDGEAHRRRYARVARPPNVHSEPTMTIKYALSNAPVFGILVSWLSAARSPDPALVGNAIFATVGFVAILLLFGALMGGLRGKSEF
jgi:hypothetical protein